MILQELQKFGVSKTFVYYNIKRLRETGSIENRPIPGHPRTVRTKNVIKAVRELIRRNPNRSGRKMAKEMKIPSTSMKRILKDDLQFKAYKKRKVAGLTQKQRAVRKERSKLLLKRHGEKSVENVIFSDEKFFYMEESLNAQNDRVYGVNFEDIPEHLRTVQRFQNSNTVMVWCGVSKKGKLPLIFIEKGAKINADYYQREILEGTLKIWAPLIQGDNSWTFQQDSAPAHKARSTQAWLKDEIPDFISAQEWPPSSPDLNPLDYSIWGILEEMVNDGSCHNLDDWKRKLEKAWDNLSMDHVRAAIDAWRRRLRACVRQNGGRFEKLK